MKKMIPPVWMGILLRGYGGKPPPPKRALVDHLGMSFTNTFGRDDLCAPDQPFVVLTELFCLPKGKAIFDREWSLAKIIELGIDDAIEQLRRIPRELFARWRDAGRELDVFLAVHTSGQEVRIHLPTKLLNICNDLGLTIEVYADNFGKDRKRRPRPKTSSPKK